MCQIKILVCTKHFIPPYSQKSRINNIIMIKKQNFLFPIAHFRLKIVEKYVQIGWDFFRSFRVWISMISL